MHEENCYVTLTYNNENLPRDRGLHHEHFQLFMKRLRHHADPGLKYYMCGEYGDSDGRPHYHALFFGFDPSDRKFYSRNKNGDNLYTSRFLEHLWGKGFVIVGDATFESAAYVARYVLKKVTGENAKRHYETIDTETGEIHSVRPEYNAMSRNPGLGKSYYEMYGSEIRTHDTVIVRGHEAKPARYYDNLHDEETKLRHKAARERSRRRNATDNTLARLRTRETIKQAQVNQLPRPLKGADNE